MNLRRSLGVFARIAISVALLVFLYARTPRFDADELLPDWNSTTVWWLVGALALTFSSHVMSTMRWFETAKAIRVPSSPGRLFSHYMAGVFVSNFVPTTVGGDVLRVRRLSKDSDDAPGAFASVTFERLSGWLVLPAISLFGLLISSRVRGLGTPTRVALIVAVVCLVGLVAVLVLAGSEVVGRRLGERTGLLSWLNGVHTGIDSMRERPRAAVRILWAAFAYQLVMMLVAWFAMQAMGIEGVGIAALLAFYPAVLILQVLPLGIGGLGVRESALVLFFGALGVPDEQSVALGLLLYFLTLASSLIGLPMLVFGDRDRPEMSQLKSHDDASGTIVSTNAPG